MGRRAHRGTPAAHKTRKEAAAKPRRLRLCPYCGRRVPALEHGTYFPPVCPVCRANFDAGRGADGRPGGGTIATFTISFKEQSK